MASGIRKVGVLGIGLMGSGIAQVAATRGFDTVVVDVTADVVKRGLTHIQEGLERLARGYEKSGGKTGIAPSETEQILSHLRVKQPRRLCLYRLCS